MNDLVSVPKELERRFDERWMHFGQLGRRTVFAAWEVGQTLKEVRDKLDDGVWNGFLERKGVSGRSARRFIQLFNGYDGSTLHEFGSVDEAIKAIPAPEKRKREPAPAASPEPEKKPGEPAANLATEPEQDAEQEPENPAEVELELQRARAEAAEADNEALREKLAMATDGGPDPELAAVEKVRERVAELDAENDRMRRAVKHQERKLGHVRSDLIAKRNHAEILRVRFGIVVTEDAG